MFDSSSTSSGMSDDAAATSPSVIGPSRGCGTGMALSWSSDRNIWIRKEDCDDSSERKWEEFAVSLKGSESRVWGGLGRLYSEIKITKNDVNSSYLGCISISLPLLNTVQVLSRVRGSLLEITSTTLFPP